MKHIVFVLVGLGLVGCTFNGNIAIPLHAEVKGFDLSGRSPAIASVSPAVLPNIDLKDLVKNPIEVIDSLPVVLPEEGDLAKIRENLEALEARVKIIEDLVKAPETPDAVLSKQSLTPDEIQAKAIESTEGLTYRPYCLNGYPHIGIGHMLQTKGESSALLCEDIKEAEGEAKRVAGSDWFSMDRRRQAALWRLCFRTSCAGFSNMIAALTRGDYYTVEAEIIDSEFARKNPATARRIAKWMREGCVEGDC